MTRKSFTQTETQGSKADSKKDGSKHKAARQKVKKGKNWQCNG